MDEKTKSRLGALQKGKELLLSKYDVGKINKFCRTVYPFTAEQMDVQGTKLNLGCYRMYIEGFTNIDIKPDVGADRVFNILEVSKFYSPGSVNMILMSQVLEHFTLEEADKLLQDVYNILCFGGRLIIEVPDCEGLDEKVSKGEMSEHAAKVFREGHPEVIGQAHKCQFVEGTLKQLLEKVGFKKMSRNPLVSDDSKAIRFDIVKV